MTAIIRGIWQLLVYLVLGIVPFVLINMVLRFFVGKERTNIMTFGLDVIICVIAHGEFRTLSGMTGEKSKKGNRYYYQEKVIDVLMYPVDGKDHCSKANIWENKIKYNYYSWFTSRN
jgi:hypothetical protein